MPSEFRVQRKREFFFFEQAYRWFVTSSMTKHIDHKKGGKGELVWGPAPAPMKHNRCNTAGVISTILAARRQPSWPVETVLRPDYATSQTLQRRRPLLDACPLQPRRINKYTGSGQPLLRGVSRPPPLESSLTARQIGSCVLPLCGRIDEVERMTVGPCTELRCGALQLFFGLLLAL